MSFSLNEVEAMARKAARGGGYSWGLAEEAGRAVRWLCARNMDGCGALAQLLERVEEVDLAQWTPVLSGGEWRAPGGLLCPIITGAALSDRAGLIAGHAIRVDAVAVPVLLIPFLAGMTGMVGQIRQPLRMATTDFDVVTDGAGVAVSGPIVGHVDSVSIGPSGPPEADTGCCTRARPKAEDWAVLDRFAHRTYAPATEASRQLGAGAGGDDND